MEEEKAGKKIKGFTIEYPRIVDTILTEAYVSYNGFVKKAVAMWDTGAMRSALDSCIIDDLEIKSESKRRMYYYGGETEADVFTVDIVLPAGIVVPNVSANSTVLEGHDFNVIIGMDIISQGDFRIDNSSGKTVFTFMM